MGWILGSCAASSAVAGDAVATTTGGCGGVRGRGTTGTSRNRKNSPAALTRSRDFVRIFSLSLCLTMLARAGLAAGGRGCGPAAQTA